MLCLIVFLLSNGYHKTTNITLSLTAFAVIIFELSHVIGVSTADHWLSRTIFLGNISVIFICTFNFHCVMAVLGKDYRRRKLIWLVYIIGISLTIFYLKYPNTFVLDSIPKMYFPNYYVPGSLHWIERVIFNGLIPLIFIYELINSFRKETSRKERKRIKHLSLALCLGWVFGSALIPLVYNIPIDPMYGIFFPILFCVPFTYAVVNHDLLDIRIVAKRAFYYGILVAICAVILIFFNFLNKWLEEIIPGIPIYVVPVISSMFGVVVGIAVWRRVREGDALKYEFITKTMHELRTPLTHIKLAADELTETPLDDKQKSTVGHIEKANDKLIELTDLVRRDGFR